MIVRAPCKLHELHVCRIKGEGGTACNPTCSKLDGWQKSSKLTWCNCVHATECARTRTRLGGAEVVMEANRPTTKQQSEGC